MKFSVATLLFLPIAVVAARMVATSAFAVGSLGANWLLPKNWHGPQWLEDLGLPSEVVCRYFLPLVLDLPTLLMMCLLSVTLFVFRSRCIDMLVIVTLLSVPVDNIVSATQFSAKGRQYYEGKSTSFLEHVDFSCKLLPTQSLTIATALLIIGVFLLCRRRITYRVPTRLNVAVNSVVILAVVVPSCWLWSMIGQ